MTQNAPFDDNDLRSLGEKLAALDLTERERAALGAVLTDDDVAGFGRFDIIPTIRDTYIVTADLQDWAARPGGRHGVRVDVQSEPDHFKPGRF